MIVDKKEYIKIKNQKPNKEFLNECKEISKMFNKDNNMNIKECEKIIKYLNMVRSNCPWEIIQEIEKHQCICESCIDCWWLDLADYIEK